MMEKAKVKEKDTSKHPCFNEESRLTYARVHLPVAPKCNIQCNFCNRKYDCINESRPGVTSNVLAFYQAVEYLKELDKHLDNISVIGIAGPGDPFANPEEVIKTLREVKKAFPDKIFCLSTNGLDLFPYIDELAELNVTHITITINAIDPEIGAKIYRWVRYGKHVYRGIEGAKLLLEKQLLCIPKLKAKGIIVKINTIIIPGINDLHIPEIARVTKDLGADIMNCIPLIPTADTPFEKVPAPEKGMIFRVRTQAKEYLPMMTHCARCRADAAGLLGQDLKESYAILREVSTQQEDLDTRPYVAVASYEGILVNQHLGEAQSVYIFEKSPKGFKYVQQRALPPAGGGDQRWINVARLLKDCRTLLVAGIGPNPESILKQCGLKTIQMTGMIDEGLDGIYNDKAIRSLKKEEKFNCGSGCKGDSVGCG